jgi:hypothetical protein
VTDPYGYDDEVGGSRRRGLWGLSVLAMIAVVVVAFVTLFTGGQKGGEDQPTVRRSVTPPALSSSAPESPAPGSSAPGSSASSSSSTPSPSRSSVSPLAESALAVAAGINRLRQEASLPNVRATTSPAADQCAATQGSGATCVPHYMYAQVSTTEAAPTVAALRSVSTPWLLDPTTRRIEIGWAKLSSGAWSCAVLKFP